MNLYTVPFYKSAPFIRLILPFISGILLQWNLHLPILVLAISILVITGLQFTLSFWPVRFQFATRAFRGLLMNLFVAVCGSLCLFKQDDNNDVASILHKYSQGDMLLVTISEPLAARLL